MYKNLKKEPTELLVEKVPYYQSKEGTSALINLLKGKVETDKQNKIMLHYLNRINDLSISPNELVYNEDLRKQIIEIRRQAQAGIELKESI